MDFKEHLTTAWQNTLKFIGPVLILTLAHILVSVFTLGILAPVTTAGYMQSLLLALRQGREPEVKDLFSEMRLFLPLLLFGLLVTVFLFIGFTLLIVPGILITAGLIFGTIYTVPLMTDTRRGLMEALKTSWSMATREPWTDQLILTLLYLVIMSLGASVAVAVLFTLPLATFLVLSVYEERLRQDRFPAAPPSPPQPPAAAG
ncbi:MAG: hypothetical protein K0A99_09405 [Desulfoarculaceae bacterium]|nr:hypothetical protein [Desulfoarculaceae bacterium]